MFHITYTFHITYLVCISCTFRISYFMLHTHVCQCKRGANLSRSDLQANPNLADNQYVKRVFGVMPKDENGDVTFDVFVRTAGVCVIARARSLSNPVCRSVCVCLSLSPPTFALSLSLSRGARSLTHTHTRMIRHL